VVGHVVGVLERIGDLLLAARLVKTGHAVGVDALLGEVVCAATGWGRGAGSAWGGRIGEGGAGKLRTNTERSPSQPVARSSVSLFERRKLRKGPKFGDRGGLPERLDL
jgi:hypothetical protein